MTDDEYVLARRNIETVIGGLKHVIKKDSEQLAREEARLAKLNEQYENEYATRNLCLNQTSTTH